MTTTTFESYGDEAKALAFEAIDMAMADAEASPSGYIPFVLVVAGDGERTMIRCVDDEDDPTVEGGVALAREQLRSYDPSTRCVALSWDGYLTLEDDRTEAVFAEVYEQGRPAGVVFAQRYERADTALTPIGNPLLLQQEPEPLIPPRTSGKADAIARIRQLAEQAKRDQR
ncbi:hypothetical protein ABZ639_14450 [Saccharomonospora sp. NPDC006951]